METKKGFRSSSLPSVDESGVIAVTISDSINLSNQEQAFFVAGFQECVKWLGNNSETKKEFRDELTSLINRHSIENGSNTPDFILCDYLTKCLETFDDIVSQREKWYDRNIEKF
jgi:hypothetical protein